MTLTSKQVEQFQNLYKEEFGLKLDFKEAQENGIQLVRLMQLIYKPMEKQDYQKINNNENYYEQARAETNL